MAVNKNELRKRQREYAGIAVLPITHSNEIVVRVKQSLAVGKGWAFLATEWKAWETSSPQRLPAHSGASSPPGGRVGGLLTHPCKEMGTRCFFLLRNLKYRTTLQHHVQALAAIAASLQGSRASVLLLPRQLGPQLSPAQGLQKCSSSSAFKHLAMNRK